MDNNQISLLKVLAEKATQENWNCIYKFDEWENYVGPEEWADIGKSVCICRYGKDAAYIAAANPQAVIELIADYERLVAENEELRANNYGPEILNDPHALTTAYFEGMVAEGKQRNIKEDRLLAEKRQLEKEVDWFADKLSQASGSMFDEEMEGLGFQCSNECEGGVCAFECRKKKWREAARRAVEGQ